MTQKEKGLNNNNNNKKNSLRKTQCTKHARIHCKIVGEAPPPESDHHGLNRSSICEYPKES